MLAAARASTEPKKNVSSQNRLFDNSPDLQSRCKRAPDTFANSTV